MMSAASKSKITGIATKNNDNGSGGDKKAPSTKALNQMCLLYPFTPAREMTCNLNTMSVATGAWNPRAEATARLVMKPT
jgi:hypothetical protein